MKYRTTLDLIVGSSFVIIPEWREKGGQAREGRGWIKMMYSVCVCVCEGGRERRRGRRMDGEREGEGRERERTVTK